MLKELNKYLYLLRKKSAQFENTDINGNEDKRWIRKKLVRILIVLVSAAFLFLIPTGFSDNFISYISSALSILVGLFITALIFSFDKFYNPVKLENASSRVKLWDTQAYNYSKKFAYIAGQTIVISIYALVLAALSAQFKDVFALNINQLEFVKSEISTKSIELFLYASAVGIQRFLIIYWMIKIVYNTLFIVSSMVEFMIIKIDRDKNA